MPDDLSHTNWPVALRDELQSAVANGNVGSTLVSETERYRIWLISIAPGERLPFHTHVLNYFWVATSTGVARSHYGDGRIVVANYALGQTKHMEFASGESMTHDLENIGDTLLTFTTVEDKRGANIPLTLQASASS